MIARRYEVYVRLVDVTQVEWHERAQFFAMAAQMMRRILVDAARARGAHKRGGGFDWKRKTWRLRLNPVSPYGTERSATKSSVDVH
jgi:hypothetical protein